MMNPKRLWSPVPRIRSGAAGAILGLAVALLAGPATQSVQAQTFTVLYSFKGSPDGYLPVAGLVRDAWGNLYGTTLYGGTYGYGTVFKINKRGEETMLYSFASGLDGANPYGGLVRDAEGNLYGTTETGGYPDCIYGYSCGTVFKVDEHGKESVLYRFGAMPDGSFPGSETLLLDEAGNIYGTTASGGDSNCNPGWGCGTVFKLDKHGLETILHTFTGTRELDGAFPSAGLVSDAKGTLYSTTSAGGAPCGRTGCGTVFKIDKTGKETVLHRFSGWTGGTSPSWPVILDDAGSIYGTAGGGSGYNGIVFKLNERDQETVLNNFSYQDGVPSGGLVRDAKGNLYGTTFEGGSDYQGTVYKLDKSGKKTILHNFTGYDGGYPIGTLIMDNDGNLYGSAVYGGNFNCSGYGGCGVVFKITP
jgi:uncharacterized repeat protein (TIGR03803 family)